MIDNFQACLAIVLISEGGWSNNPDDPGGATMKGVIQTVYNDYRRGKGLPLRTVRLIEDRELQEIYRTRYWNKIGGDTLPRGTDLAAFDLGVNSGPARAVKYLAACRGLSDIETIKKICAMRSSFLQGLGTFKVFGKGWMRRVAMVEAKALQMAGATSASIATEKAAATKKVETAKKGAVAAGGGGAVAPTIPVDQAHHGWVLFAFIAVAVVVAGVFAYRAFQNSERAKALQEAING